MNAANYSRRGRSWEFLNANEFSDKPKVHQVLPPLGGRRFHTQTVIKRTDDKDFNFRYAQEPFNTVNAKVCLNHPSRVTRYVRTYATEPEALTVLQA